MMLLLMTSVGAETTRAKLDRSLVKDPSNPKLLYQRAILDYRAHNYLGCVRDASRSIAADPKPAKTFILRGHAYWRLDRYEAAAQDFRWAFERDPKNTAAFLFYYLACEKMGQANFDELRELAKTNRDPVLLMMVGRIQPQAYLSTVEMSETNAKLLPAARLQAKFFVAHYYRLTRLTEESRRLLRHLEGRETEFLWART